MGIATLARCAILAFCMSTAVSASSVLQLDLASLAAKAETVVVVEVMDRRVERGDGSGPMHTWLSLRVDRVLAGAAAKTLQLRFLGGEHGSVRQQVAGFDIPPTGERAIYFIENSQLPMAVPLLGWDQGRFLLRSDANGVERVFSAQGMPVLGLDSSRGAAGLSAGLAAGVITGSATQSEQALALDDFASHVRQLREQAYAR
jgi:hypothetical protein